MREEEEAHFSVRHSLSHLECNAIYISVFFNELYSECSFPTSVSVPAAFTPCSV